MQVGVFVVCCCLVTAISAQSSVRVGDVIQQTLRNSFLTTSGKPFHALLQIGRTGEQYSGTVEVWWQQADKYKVDISSPDFKQVRVRNGTAYSEQTLDDYYPRWLQDFVLGLIEPAPFLNILGGPALSASRSGESICLRQDNRPNGITDQLTWGVLCLHTPDYRLESVLSFNHNLTLSDWKKFEDKEVAYSYSTEILDYQHLQARLTRLDPLTDLPPDFFKVSENASSPGWNTVFVSTSQEEAMLAHVPTIKWPPVREGKTDGYMIVFARTDRTGQVRETAKHNSDQPGLEDYGMQQALLFKFKPLVVNGVSQQMEMPLVLHFTSRLEDPLPVLGIEEMRRQITGCKLPALTDKQASVTIELSVNESGKLTGEGPTEKQTSVDWLPAMRALNGCHYEPLIRNGHPTYYKGLVKLPL